MIQTNIHIPATNTTTHFPTTSISMTHWRTLVALRRDWGVCVPLNMQRQLSEDHSGTLRQRTTPLLQQESVYNVYVSVTQSQHPLHVVRSTILINMLPCCAIVLAYITQKPAVCYASMSLPVQQFVLHIPRHHHIVRGMMLIGLKVWKSPLFNHWDSLSKTHTFIYTCAWKNQHQQKHHTHWNCGLSGKKVLKWLTVGLYRATIQYSINVWLCLHVWVSCSTFFYFSFIWL